MTPVAKKFNLLRFFGNFFIKLRKELKEINSMDVPPEGEFLSSMFHMLFVLMKVGILFFTITFLLPAVIMCTSDNLGWIGKWIYIVAIVDYFNACLETYDEEPKGDE